MGFRLQIQADYGREMLCNLHPDRKPSGGKAVLAFLTGLWNYVDGLENSEQDLNLGDVNRWFNAVERTTGILFMPACHALLACMWGDGGDPTEYREDEYNFYLHRNPSSVISEEEFKKMVRDYFNHWKPIEEVRTGVQILLKVFNHPEIEPLEGFFDPGDTIPDFEALDANLALLVARGAEDVRLNFN